MAESIHLTDRETELATNVLSIYADHQRQGLMDEELTLIRKAAGLLTVRLTTSVVVKPEAAKSLGQVCYEAYFHAEIHPAMAWPYLNPDEQQKWEKIARTVAIHGRGVK